MTGLCGEGLVDACLRRDLCADLHEDLLLYSTELEDDVFESDLLSVRPSITNSCRENESGHLARISSNSGGKLRRSTSNVSMQHFPDCPMIELSTDTFSNVPTFRTTTSQTLCGTVVRAHVYDLARLTKMIHVKVFHIGVEVYGFEFFFSVKGILCCMPGCHRKHIHRKAVLVGFIQTSCEDTWNILEEMSAEWNEGTYSLLRRNCQTFAEALCSRLGLPNCIPKKYLRFSAMGTGWNKWVTTPFL